MVVCRTVHISLTEHWESYAEYSATDIEQVTTLLYYSALLYTPTAGSIHPHLNSPRLFMEQVQYSLYTKLHQDLRVYKKKRGGP